PARPRVGRRFDRADDYVHEVKKFEIGRGRAPSLPLKCRYLEIDLRSQFYQPSAHDLEYVPPRVIRGSGGARLLAQDGLVVDNVVDVEVRLHPSSLAELENPAETQIELFDPLPVKCVQ